MDNNFEPSTFEKPPLKQVLIEKAIGSLAWDGIRNLTMRGVSAEAGGTTAAIVHHYGSKAGLIAAAIVDALEEERAFHQRWRAKIRGRMLGHLNFVEWVCLYIFARRSATHARFWSELLFHAKSVPACGKALAEWHQLRAEFFSEILLEQGCDPSLGSYIVTYLCMEEAWAQGLSNFEEYQILLRETLRALTTKMFGARWTEIHSVSDWLEERLDKFSIQPPQNPDAMEQRLLAIAAQDVLESGLSLNQRRITDKAGTSPSMIAYHFENMTTFRTQAVWTAMLRPFDDPLNPYDRSRSPHSLEDWATRMAEIIMPMRGTVQAGSYASFARTIGEIALLSHREPEMRPLAEHLRILDGTASFHAGNTIWKKVVQFKRGQASAFAVWLKGQALLSEALKYRINDNKDALMCVVTRLL